MTKTEAACCVGLVRMHGGHELADKLMAKIMPPKVPAALSTQMRESVVRVCPICDIADCRHLRTAKAC